MDKKILIYYPFELKSAISGSAVRPQKILINFRKYCNDKGIQLIEIYGESKIRKHKIKKFISGINPKEVLFCYVESSTLPIWLTDGDHLPRSYFFEEKFFKYLKHNEIPLGLFYRDIYWKFDEYTLTGIKRLIMRFIYNLELSLYKKYIDLFFVPSMEMNNYVGFPAYKTRSLPPGAENCIQERIKYKSNEINLIYVGGISERYGLIEMLEAVSLTYKKNKNVILNLVCRKEEYQKYKSVLEEYNKNSWLKIYHAFGEQLKEIYRYADIAIIPIKKTAYNDFAVPVKLFEYMSYGLPMISTNCNAQSKIISDNKLGIVVDDTVEGLKKGIEYFLLESNRQFHSRMVEKALLEGNLWIHRVEKIEEMLFKNR